MTKDASVAQLLIVSQPNDWTLLTHERENPLTTVIDPTVVRVADIFARGRSGAEDQPIRAWKLIAYNLADLAAFVDALVLEPGLVIPDYGGSFLRKDLDQDWHRLGAVLPPLFDICQPVVAPIMVQSPAWHPLAKQFLQQLDEATPLPKEVTTQLQDRLASMQWSFGPELPQMGYQWQLSDSMLVNGFLYVTLLFGQYAGALGGTQLLSPAATSALLTAELSESGGAGKLSDADLFKNLQLMYDNVSGAEKRTLRLERPSFLPYLLSIEGVDHPADLFRAAIAQREESEVQEYRKWLAGVQRKIEGGTMPHEAERDVKQIIDDIAHRYETRDSLVIPVQASFGLWPPTLAIGATGKLDLTRLRDWVLRTRPGLRYRRVLLNLTLAGAEAVQVDQHLRKLWNAA
jgi:hypothetical protein